MTNDNEFEVTEETAATATEDTKRPSTPGERAAVAERVRLWRARQKKAETRDLVLSENQQEKIRASTTATFAKVFNRLSEEQKLALENWTDELPSLRAMNEMLFEVVALCDLELFSECRPDLVGELLSDFLVKYPFARNLVLPRAAYADEKDRTWLAEYGHRFYAIKGESGDKVIEFDLDGPEQFSLGQFRAAVKRYQKYRRETSLGSADVEPEPVKRGRPRKVQTETKVPEANATAVDSAQWSTPPALPQADHWASVAADRAAIAIKQQQEQAAPSMPVVFPRMNEL